MIVSSQNPRLKLARALLGRPKERQEAGAFMAEGVRLVEEALAAGWPFRFVLYSEKTSERGATLVHKLRNEGVDVEEVAAHLLEALSDTGNSQGVLAVLELPATRPIPVTLDLVLIADQIRDPGNLGTLLRTAAAAGVQAVLLPPETTDAFAPKVVRAGMGAHFQVPILALDWEAIRAQTAGLQVLLADMEGNSCWETDLRGPAALIVGSEAEGASSQARSLATSTIRIPMTGKIESLNASVAGAILLFEIVRQRSKEKK